MDQTNHASSWLNGSETFVIAEAGVNHNGSIDLALELVRCAKRAGADAVKFQTFTAEQLVTMSAPKAAYQQRSGDARETQFEMLKRLELDRDAHLALIDECRKQDILFMSTPFNHDAADLLMDLGVQAFKVSSGDATNVPFLRYLGAFGIPVILSTGMCRLQEVEIAVEALEESGCEDLALLHCVSNYPADPADTNLRAMLTMAQAFGKPVGYSDHTLGNEVCFAAVALGARIVEKHFTLDQTMPGPDHAASSEPAELKALVSGIRKIESCLGNGRKRPAANELSTAAVARKSLVAAIDLEPGTVIREDSVAIKRPGNGLPPVMRPHLLNRTVRNRIPAGSLLRLEDLA